MQHLDGLELEGRRPVEDALARPEQDGGDVERQLVDHARGVATAYTYGAPGDPGSTGDMQYLNAFFLLTDRPEAYNLPAAPTRPSNRVKPALAAGLMAVAVLALGAVAAFSQDAPRHGR